MLRSIWTSLCHCLMHRRPANRVVSTSVNASENEATSLPHEVAPADEVESTLLEVITVSPNEEISKSSLPHEVAPADEVESTLLEVITVSPNEEISKSSLPHEVAPADEVESTLVEVISILPSDKITKSSLPREVVPADEVESIPVEVIAFAPSAIITQSQSLPDLVSTHEVESQSSPDLTSAHEVESILPFEEKEMPPNETVFGSYFIPDSTTRFDQEEIQEHPSIKKIMNLAKAFIAFRLFGILLVFVDAGLIIMESILSRNELHIPVQYRMISLAIAIFFFIEILLQVYMDGKKYYFSDLLNIFDTVIIVITLCIDVTFIFFYSTILKNLPRVAVIFRPIRLVTLLRLFHLANQKRLLEQSARRMVSGNKRRYSKDGFDLDLTYVTARIIAMSFPSSGRRSFYRNPIEEVARFLDTKHFGHYFVYNLCREKSYNPMYFHDRVSRIKIDDHNVPSLREMILLARDAADWLAKDPQNVIAVHCKGGKGRTGTMICACLLANGMFSTAKESLYYFGVRRTDKSKSKKFQGVETPSQSRYVRYFETVKNVFHWSLPPEKTLKIKKIVIYSIHGVGRGDGTDITVEIIMQNKTMFTCTSQTCQLIHNMETNEAIFVIPNCPDLCDDVKVKFLSPNLPNYYDDCAFFLWFHTSFTEKNRLFLSREELDNPHKCKTWHIYRPDFGVELYFEQVDAK